MFELTDEIMRQRDSKLFAERLTRLCECKHTASDVKLKGVVQEDTNNPFDAPHLYKQNAN